MAPLFPTGMEDRGGHSSQGQRLTGSYMELKVSVKKKPELNLTQSPAEPGGRGALITVTDPSSSDRNSSRAKKRRTALPQLSHIPPPHSPAPIMWPLLSWVEGSASTTHGNGCPHSADGATEALNSAEFPHPSRIFSSGSAGVLVPVSLKTQTLKPPPYMSALCQKRWLSWKHRCKKKCSGAWHFVK